MRMLITRQRFYLYRPKITVYDSDKDQVLIVDCVPGAKSALYDYIVL